jgi:acyl dehydratase
MLFHEAMKPGDSLTSPTVTVDGDEMVEFARRWDPLPIHVDEVAAKASGALTAPGLFTLAIKQRLLHQLPQLAVLWGWNLRRCDRFKPLVGVGRL